MPSNAYVHIVTPAEANDIIAEKDPIILDVRTPTEFKEKHIDGAVNIPFDEINRETISKISSNFDDVIVVYCAVGARSAIASATLVDLGYNNVYDLTDGIERWPFGVVPQSED